MIKQITKKAMEETREGRKHGREFEHLDFQAPDGKYYRSDIKGGQGLKDIVAWNKRIKTEMNSQVAMLDVPPVEIPKKRKAPARRSGVYHH